MRILKRIIYTLLGLLIAGTVALVGIILYAEYSGNRFTPDSIPALAKLESTEDESRLAYDENGNLLELPEDQNDGESSGASAQNGDNASPDGTESTDTAQGNSDSGGADGTSTANSAPAGTDSGTGAPSGSGSSTDTPSDSATGSDTPSGTGTAAGSTGTASASSGSDAKRSYVMDLGSGIFHTADCPYAANIAEDKRSEMTTTGSKIMDAGYQPCTNCHPDTAP